jgi:hypothetical protein
VVPRGGSRGGEGRLWLSEPAMVGAGLRPGCLVSVCSSSSSSSSPSSLRITFCATFYTLLHLASALSVTFLLMCFTVYMHLIVAH